jgi:hypothetical protein
MAPDAVGVVSFVQALLRMSRPRIQFQAAGLRARRSSADDDIAWWDATLALDRALRSGGLGNEAAMAAHVASEAVLTAAARTGLAPSPDVTAVAQSAGEVARVLVAGRRNTVAYLTHGWEDILLIPGSALPPRPGPAHTVARRAPRAIASQPRKGRRA